jgi:chemotaxis protein methyltransferase CheR
MFLLDHFPPAAGWKVEIWATDLTKRVLEHAVEGIWDESDAAGIPPAYLKKFMLQGTGAHAGKVKVGHRLQSVVTFARMNLMWDQYEIPGLFDLIFCRNVLIYFDRDTRVRVVEKLLGHLSSRGLFFLGHSESLMSTSLPVRSVHPTIYTKVEASE